MKEGYTPSGCYSQIGATVLKLFAKEDKVMLIGMFASDKVLLIRRDTQMRRTR